MAQPDDTLALLVARLYDTAFDRYPDLDGAANWAGVLAGGASLRSVSDRFFASAEFTARHAGQDDAAFVRSLYRDALERDADEAGLANWVGLLAGGTSRADVFFAFLDCDEQKQGFSRSEVRGVEGFDPDDGASPTDRLVARLYDTAFDRLPDPGGAATWAGVLASGASLRDVARLFFTCDEFTARHVGQDDAAFVRSLYRDALEREPDAAGLAGWVDRLANGTSRFEVFLAFLDSEEQKRGFSRSIAQGVSGASPPPLPDPFDAVDDAYETTSGVELVVGASAGLFANDVSPDGRPFPTEIGDFTTARGGNVDVDSDGSFTYTPPDGFVGVDSFTYTIKDGDGSQDTATVRITVGPDRPVDAVDDAYAVQRNSGTNAFSAAQGVLANDSAPDGGLGVVGFVVGGNTYLTLATGNGFASIRPDGSFDYTPAQGFAGTDTLTYRVQDANGSTDDATITITVGSGSTVNAVDDAYAVLRDSSNFFTGARGVLANDTAPSGGLRVLGLVSAGQAYGSLATANGSLASITSDGSLSFTPAPGFTGTETLTYRAQDADGSTDDATITVTVGSGGGNPVDAVDDAYRTDRGVPLLVAAVRGLLANDRAPDGGAAAGAGTFPTAQGGSVAVQASGAFAYTPPSGFTGADSFQYGLTDVDGSTDTATATITVAAPTPIPPVQLSDVALGTGGRRIRGEIGGYGRAGTSVAGVGDLDSDGRPDLLIGAPNLTVYLGASPYRVVTGAAYLLFSSGGVTDLGVFNPFINPAGSNGGFRIVAEGGPDQAGQSVAGAGDVNGDGIPDLVVGAPGNDMNTATPYNDGAGAAYVVFGKRGAGEVDLADVAGGSGGFKMIGVRTGDLAGLSVSGAGDVNGDGLADVLVGAPFADVGGYTEGAAYVVFGKAGTALVNLADVAAGVGGFVINGQAGGGGSSYYAGSSVSSAGDMNGDGLADLLVGDENAGAAYVVFGKADTAAVDLGAVAAGAGGFRIANTGRPARVAGAGDVNGDGTPDVVVGASANRPVSTALGTLATVVFGKADGAEVDVSSGGSFAGFRVVGLDDVGNTLGAAVSAAGDLNGDGLGDVLIGAPGAYGDKAYVVFGKTDTADVNTADLAAGIGGFKILPEGAFDVLGISVSAAGDANGDGLDDLLVGSWAVDNGFQRGATYLIYGSPSWVT